jgi:DUF4097 and DUF4098 domain-containing protein YvlB
MMMRRRGSTQSRDRQGAVHCRRSPAHRCLTVAALCLFLPAAIAQQFTCKDGRCERILNGTAPASPRLRVDAHGPVTLVSGVSQNLTFTVKVTVNARNEAEARRILLPYVVRVQSDGVWTVLTAPGGAILTDVTVRAPALEAAAIETSDGAVQAIGIAGPLTVDTGAGAIAVDRIGGDCNLMTGGGRIDVGQVGGSLKCSTGAGPIAVSSVHGSAILTTDGGDILAHEAGAMVHAETRGGGVHIGTAGGPVTAVTGGGEIVVEKAGGIVTLRNMAGPVQVGSAAGVRCEASGGIRVANVTGPMRVATSMGSILANLMGSHLADSYLATGNGDITVLIPSNVGVTILAENGMADTLKRISSDFAAVQPRRQGTRVVASGAINGGGPLLQISGMGGTIFIKRQ